MKREICALRAELHDKQKLVKYAQLNQPFVRCITGYFCSVCKPDYTMAVVMALHKRLGEHSPMAMLTGDLLHIIIEMTKPKRKLPAWMSCSWNLNFAKKKRARTVLECSRAAQRQGGSAVGAGDAAAAQLHAQHSALVAQQRVAAAQAHSAYQAAQFMPPPRAGGGATKKKK